MVLAQPSHRISVLISSAMLQMNGRAFRTRCHRAVANRVRSSGSWVAFQSVLTSHVGRVLSELHKAIATSDSSRILRVSLTKFAHLCRFIKQQKCRCGSCRAAWLCESSFVGCMVVWIACAASTRPATVRSPTKARTSQSSHTHAKYAPRFPRQESQAQRAVPDELAII